MSETTPGETPVERRLRELAYHGLLADPHGHATAACLAGAEALRLLREYQRAHADHQRAKHEDVGQEITWAARKAAKRALLATEVTR